MKLNFKKFIPYQSEFSHYYATWASNHCGWSKMKKTNRKVAKTKLNREFKRIINEEITNYRTRE